MESICQILHHRHKRLQQQKHNPLNLLGLAFSALVSLSLLLVIFITLSAYTSLTRDLPSLQSLPDLLDPLHGSLLQPTRIYDRTGEHLILALQDPRAAGSQYLSLESIPQTLVDAYLATFEPQYFESPGYTLHGVWCSQPPSAIAQPIAQKLVSELLLWDEAPSLRRAWRERLLAAQLVKRYGHDQVLEWSLNTTQFGPLIYGVDAAAQVYFGKTAADLNLGESALLVAAALSPDINPLELPQVFLEQQKTVLHAMLINSLVTAETVAQTIQLEYTFSDPIPPTNPAPAFTNLVLEQLSAYYPLARIQRGGLKVTTTMDYDLQLQALCTTAVHMARLEGKLTTEVTIEGQACEAARLLPTLPTDQKSPRGDLTASIVILEPGTGHILALVGELAPGADPAHQPGQPAGSILTPFVYMAGFTRGLNPATLVWDLPPSQLETSDNQSSVNPTDYHGPLRLRTALTNDYLQPARDIVQQLGTDTILRLTQGLGLESLKGLPAGDLDMLDQPVLLLDIAHTYSIFANQGTLAGRRSANPENSSQQAKSLASIEPAAVISLEDLYGNIWLDLSGTQKQAILAPQLAYLMTNILSDETARWPSLGHPNPLEIGRPAAAKLGISSDNSSAWSVGFTPQRLIGVWLGYNQESPAMVTPVMPAALWYSLMQYACRELPSQGWEMPPGVTTVAVCDPSGLLPTDKCPNVVDEIFLSGTEPIQQDNLYQTFQVNRETGNLATIFTAPEMVEERTYLVLPPEALDWARQTGLPIPPDSYDIIYIGLPNSTDVKIDSPSMFGYVRGSAQIIGSAGGKGFDYYRLQAGQGLNPQTWLTISEDITTPVSDSLLGSWDTEGLSGLYTLQLLVVRNDQSVDRSILQVTIDNSPPQLTIINPTNEQQIKITPGLKALLQVEASDDLQIAKIEFYIDEQLVASLNEAPYNLPWQGLLGEHTLKVIAYDLAGNTAQSAVDFQFTK